jgi:hypothetical protein
MFAFGGQNGPKLRLDIAHEGFASIASADGASHSMPRQGTPPFADLFQPVRKDVGVQDQSMRAPRLLVGAPLLPPSKPEIVRGRPARIAFRARYIPGN